MQRPRVTYRSIGYMMVIAALLGCEGHPPPQDTDRELFRTEEQLTNARVLNLAKRVADFYRAEGQLPTAIDSLRSFPVVTDPKENPRNDGWGRPIVLAVTNESFELRSAGPDRVIGTGDDIVYRVEHPDSIR